MAVLQNGISERKLTELLPAKRNRYYYGKLMDVLHFSMEQQYALSKQWLFNRTVLGSGVVCGLGVEPISNSSGNGVVIRAGLAIDGWGREIIVPNDVQIVPLALTDQCGSPQPPSTQPLPNQVKIQVCYNECPTDYSPSLVSDPDCGCGDSCEAGTVVESYCLKVLVGAGDPVTIPCLDDVKKGLAKGDVHAVLCELSKSCAPDPDDPCLTLANLTVASDGTLTIDDCTPRAIAPTNVMLIQLISCLADCCAGTPAAQPLQVTGVAVLSTGSINPKVPGAKPDDPTLSKSPIAVLTPPSRIIKVPIESKANIIEVTLGSSPPLEPTSVAVTPAAIKTVVITPPGRTADQIIPMGGNVFRIFRTTGYVQGPTKVILVGGPEGAVASPPPAISAQDGTRLDGEWPGSPAAGGPGWHSGEGTQGGNFDFELNLA